MLCISITRLSEVFVFVPKSSSFDVGSGVNVIRKVEGLKGVANLIIIGRGC